MSFQVNKEDMELLKKIIVPEIFVITKKGLAKVLSIDKYKVLTHNTQYGDVYYNYDEIIPIMKGFEHLTFLDLFNIVDIITERVGYGNYKPNHNFVPHYYEVTEESIDLKVQIYHNFDIVHCDNQITNLGSVYHYLLSKNYDIYNLHKKGLVIIDPSYYGTNNI
jgi:hypothetical protein